MNHFEVRDPILNSAFEEPKAYWHISENAPAELREGRRPSLYFPPDPRPGETYAPGSLAIELKMVNLIRQRVADWRKEGYPGASRVTQELLLWWRRDGRKQSLFFAQIEAAETILFLQEARADFRQGIQIARDLRSGETDTLGGSGFLRYACKLATGSGKTTVMAMLSAWSILNKVADRTNKSYSDVVLAVCPNVTIRNRLSELDPELGEASLYRTRDLVPEHLMPQLCQGRVIITNWHIFEPKMSSPDGGRVVKTGKKVTKKETIALGQENTTARGKRYLTWDSLQEQLTQGLLEIIEGSEKHDKQGNLISVRIQRDIYVESDTSVVRRILGREVGQKSNILILNDEAHHAYRVRRNDSQEELELDEENLDEDEVEELKDYYREATVWVEGLDRINKQCGINFCVDLSATPYFLGRVGQDANRPFPWVVSDFGLVEAIESGLVKIPQLAVRDSTGKDMPGFFNIWRFVMDRLSGSEKGGKRVSPRPEAVLKHAAFPILQLAGLWEEEAKIWKIQGEARSPVFIIVCKNTKIAEVIYDWLAEDRPPAGIARSPIEGFKNKGGLINTIRVDSKVAAESGDEGSKSVRDRWMRLQLDTVGRLDWPRDRVGRPLMPADFIEVAQAIHQTNDPPLQPPGRDVRCIVSVGMLTEGWDCSTVTHIVGLRPFMSQLLCEQVVGRGLRRRSYQADDEGHFTEEVARVFGVPFEVIPFKETGVTPPVKKERHRIYAVDEKKKYEITFPRVVGYVQAISDDFKADWTHAAHTVLDPMQIPPETQMQGWTPNMEGRLSLSGIGKLETISLEPLRKNWRLQKLEFSLASELTKYLIEQRKCTMPAQSLFPRLLKITHNYFDSHVEAQHPFEKVDAFHSPFYGLIFERINSLITMTHDGHPVEVPVLEKHRPIGRTSEVDYWTTKEIYPVEKSHLNAVVADTKQLEQAAAYQLDRSEIVQSFVKNTVDSKGEKTSLGFSIPFLQSNQQREYYPDFIVHLNHGSNLNLILETKGFPDPDKEDKAKAAERWVQAVNQTGLYGRWSYAVITHPKEIPPLLKSLLQS